MVHLLDIAVAVHYETVAAKMVLHIEMHYYSIVVIHTCVAAVEEDGGNVVLTSSLKKHAFYNLLINNILYLCVT